ncbi:MAG: AAA family ATPase [Alphaproteobacteria bacterium]
MTDQADVLALLADPAAHGPGVDTVERVDTHISSVFLAGDRAWKLKRAVRLPFLDFTTVAARRTFCRREVVVNRAAAPTLYLGVAPVERLPDGRLVIGAIRTDDPEDAAENQAVDWLVAMRRFDQDTLFDRLARRGQLTDEHMRRLGEVVARFHGAAAPRPDRGGLAAMRAVVEGNRLAAVAFVPAVFTAAAVADLTQAILARLDAVGDLLEARRAAGLVRHCHGDLHLGNICLVDGQPTLFDAIEFNEDFAVIDIAYDLAFLLMDLESRGLRPLASTLFNDAMAHGGDTGALPLLPVFLAMRAFIRAHVAAAMARETEARHYLALAGRLLEPVPPRLVAVGGLSGSGKSLTSRLLAPAIGAAPGALVVRSDVLRKRLLGSPLYERLGPDGYTAAMTRRTYQALYDEAERALRAGHSVIADAVFADPAERRTVEDLARRLGVPFHGLWLEASPATMADRIASRRRAVSDATGEVLERQLGYDLGDMAWSRIDSSGPRGATVTAARRIIGIE